MKHRPFLKFPLSALIVILMIYGGITVLTLTGDWTWDLSIIRRDLWLARFFILGTACFIAGAARVALFHPRFATKYGTWLSGTPWRPGLDLPLGPVALVWEDLLLVVPLGVLAVMDALVPLWVPVLFYLLGYIAIAVASMRSILTRRFSFGLLFLASLPVLWHNHIAVLAAALAAVTIIAHIALSISLRHFPWDLGDSMREFKKRPRIDLAWPINRVGPGEPDKKPIPPIDGWIGAILCGWWIFVLLKISLIGDIGPALLTPIVMKQGPGYCVVFAAMRALLYCAPYWPPISLRGRLMTGRFIIPGYDYVFISPLVMTALAYGLPPLLITFLPLPIVAGLTVTAVAAVGFNGGPTLRRWQLTGHHRLFPGGRREPPVPKSRAARRFG